jgi:hypothetical protein
MWQVTTEPLSGGQAWRFTLVGGGGPLGYDEVLHGWRHDEAFRTFFIRLLADAPFAAYRWETPPLTRQTIARPFEFVLLDEPGLDAAPDDAAFADQFAAASGVDSVIVFANLGKDAVLVVPRPMGALSAYAHLAAFLRHAPAGQRHELWQAVGAATEAEVSDSPIWLSTAGMGVAWLHVRLDSRPKYYGFRPYARLG